MTNFNAFWREIAKLADRILSMNVGPNVKLLIVGAGFSSLFAGRDRLMLEIEHIGWGGQYHAYRDHFER